jgi:hypothetical protein
MSTYTVATTKAEADDHLEILRQERGFDGTQVEKSALVQSLDQALNMYIPTYPLEYGILN